MTLRERWQQVADRFRWWTATPIVVPVRLNEYGSLVSVHRCRDCGGDFTVCPPVGPEWGDGCLSEVCSSYDPRRDADIYFELGLVERDREVQQ